MHRQIEAPSGFGTRSGEVMADRSEATLQRWEGDRRLRPRDAGATAAAGIAVLARELRFLGILSSSAEVGSAR